MGGATENTLPGMSWCSSYRRGVPGAIRGVPGGMSGVGGAM